jgi:hypothetical protein
MANMSDPTCALTPGYYGPVTATLDWCEVRRFYTTDMLKSEPINHLGQLSILSLCRRNGEYLLECVLDFLGGFRCASGCTSIFTCPIHLWTCRIFTAPLLESFCDRSIGDRTGRHRKLCFSCNVTFPSTIG